MSLSRKNSFEYINQSPMDAFMEEFGTPAGTLREDGTAVMTTLGSPLISDDLGDLMDTGLNSPRMDSIMNMTEEEFVNSCDQQVPEDFEVGKVFYEAPANGADSLENIETDASEVEEESEEESDEVEEESEEESDEEEEESTDVNQITVDKLEALVEEYKQKDVSNKRKLDELQERIDEMDGEIDQHMEDKDELQAKIDKFESRDPDATDSESEDDNSGEKIRRCHHCKAAEANVTEPFNQVHFHHVDELGNQHDIEYYCPDCKPESYLRSRALEFANEVHADCHGDFGSVISRLPAVVIPGCKKITFAQLKHAPVRPAKRRRVSPHARNVFDFSKPVDSDRPKEVPCPWGCGFVFCPDNSNNWDLRKLKQHIADPKNGCISPEQKMVVPTTVSNVPYYKRGIECPSGTPGIEALIKHGFKKLKTNTDIDWVGDFLKHRCGVCDFRHYNKSRTEEHRRRNHSCSC